MNIKRVAKIIAIGDIQPVTKPRRLGTWWNPFITDSRHTGRGVLKVIAIFSIILGLFLAVNTNYAERWFWGSVIVFLAVRQVYYTIISDKWGAKGFYATAAVEYGVVAAMAAHQHVVKQAQQAAQQQPIVAPQKFSSPWWPDAPQG